MQKLVNIDHKYLIYCNSAYGPTFGGSSTDLGIVDHCNIANNYGNFPTAYNCEGPMKYVKNQESYKAFSGATSGQFFKIFEYEVYQVLY